MPEANRKQADFPEGAEILANPDSLTGAYLSGRRGIPVPARRRAPGPRALAIHGCREHNLKDVTLRVPLGRSSNSEAATKPRRLPRATSAIT